ncbi:hypothetical protein GCM10010969_25210 [Saccharibacillus kuerlensis]|uniref:Uncharacterized protein n=1 Tax=Saccharibacillus kuerlensis TaxID=459527 RepID=A0ABQ2L678_9BACL|nr:hypothetical protein GCM10010969_25210 [Saccharibacillus kuerlensis]
MLDYDEHAKTRPTFAGTAAILFSFNFDAVQPAQTSTSVCPMFVQGLVYIAFTCLGAAA